MQVSVFAIEGLEVLLKQLYNSDYFIKISINQKKCYFF